MALLKFLGNGSCFNVKRGNNAAFYYENLPHRKIMNLFDCGGTTFSKILEYDLLNGVDKLYIYITHTHADHVGSLADLIFYVHFYKCDVDLTICAPLKIMQSIRDLLSINGIPKVDNNNCSFYNYDTFFDSSLIEVEHVPELKSYSFFIDTAQQKKVAYYSGDTKSIPVTVIKNIDELKELYIDIGGGGVHLSLEELAKLIPNIEHRKKIYCMHIPEPITDDMIKELGFNVAEIYNPEEK